MPFPSLWPSAAVDEPPNLGGVCFETHPVAGEVAYTGAKSPLFSLGLPLRPWVGIVTEVTRVR